MANLAMLELDPRELSAYAVDVEELLDFVGRIDSALKDCSPEALSVSHVDFNSLRKDSISDSLSREEILQNVREWESGFVKLRKRA